MLAAILATVLATLNLGSNLNLEVPRLQQAEISERLVLRDYLKHVSVSPKYQDSWLKCIHFEESGVGDLQC